MIDDLSVSVSSHLLYLNFLFFIFLCHCSHFLSIWTSESNGARGRRWRRGKGNKARSPAPAYSAFQSYCFNRKEVRQVTAGTTTLVSEMWCSHRATCLFLFTVVFSLPYFSKLDTDHLYMAYADIMAKVSHWMLATSWGLFCEKCTSKSSSFFLFLWFFLELPYWWGRRRGRGNGGKCWGWAALWGATVRTGNGRPGARDQEHSGAVALNALSDLIIGNITSQPHLSLCLSTSLCCVCALSLLFLCCVSFIVSCFI